MRPSQSPDLNPNHFVAIHLQAPYPKDAGGGASMVAAAATIVDSEMGNAAIGEAAAGRLAGGEGSRSREVSEFAGALLASVGGGPAAASPAGTVTVAQAKVPVPRPERQATDKNLDLDSTASWPLLAAGAEGPSSEPTTDRSPNRPGGAKGPLLAAKDLPDANEANLRTASAPETAGNGAAGLPPRDPSWVVMIHSESARNLHTPAAGTLPAERGGDPSLESISPASRATASSAAALSSRSTHAQRPAGSSAGTDGSVAPPVSLLPFAELGAAPGSAYKTIDASTAANSEGHLRMVFGSLPGGSWQPTAAQSQAMTADATDRVPAELRGATRPAAQSNLRDMDIDAEDAGTDKSAIAAVPALSEVGGVGTLASFIGVGPGLVSGSAAPSGSLRGETAEKGELSASGIASGIASGPPVASSLDGSLAAGPRPAELSASGLEAAAGLAPGVSLNPATVLDQPGGAVSRGTAGQATAGPELVEQRAAAGMRGRIRESETAVGAAIGAAEAGARGAALAESANASGANGGQGSQNPSGGDALARMDSGAEAPSSRLAFHSLPRTFEVGVDDPAHGWIEVRAQGASGQVSASLKAASPEARAALDSQLPAMTQYLSERELGVRTLEVRSSEGSGFGAGAHASGSFTGEGFSGNSGSGASPGSGGQPGAGADRQMEGDRVVLPADPSATRVRAAVDSRASSLGRDWVSSDRDGQLIDVRV